MKQIPWRHVHFIGIGGVGMSGLAQILLDLGVSVSGSDQVKTMPCRRLETQGATFFSGHDAEHVPDDTDFVVFSSAVTVENPERRAAIERNIPSCLRGEFLARLAEHFKYVVSVAGSHGKTTTTAMIAHILREVGRRPGFLVGGEMPDWRAPASAGNGRTLVTEVDESDGTQAFMKSTHAVVINVEDDHCWSVGGLKALEDCFRTFAFNSGNLIAWQSPKTHELFDGHPNLSFCDAGDIPEDVKLRIPGKYNRINAALAVKAARELGVSRQGALEAVKTFPGVSRRMSIHYRSLDGDMVLIEDYAHHPTELEGAITALRNNYPNHKLCVVFQPHRFERVKRYSQDFARILSKSDQVVVTVPFSAWKSDDELAAPRRISEHISEAPVVFWDHSMQELADELTHPIPQNTVIAVIGAGDVSEVIPHLKARLKGHEKIGLFRELKDRLPKLNLLREKPWKALCSVNVGSSTPLLAKPETMHQLQEIIRFASEKNMPVSILGFGTNIVGTDVEPVRLVIKLTEGEFAERTDGENGIIAGCGMGLGQLLRVLADEGKLESKAAGLVWIPGTVGGAVNMNAGAHGAEVGDYIKEIHGIDSEGNKRILTGSTVSWGYRQTNLPEEFIITHVVFDFGKGDPNEANEKILDTGEMRSSTQPNERSAGCIFCNPSPDKAWELISDCGLRGFTKGKVRISNRHANFLICEKNALEADVIDLVLQVQNIVYRKSGVLLRPEVEFAGSLQSRRLKKSIIPYNVVVLKGGVSSERSVSLESGEAVADSLRKAGYNVSELDITSRELPELPPGTDVVFPALHGEFGEDGELQKLLEENDLHFVGSGSKASALIMDKIKTKEIFKACGIPTPASAVLESPDAPVPEGFQAPLIVKPACSGSTVGIVKVDSLDSETWKSALQTAFKAGNNVLCEQFINGREITVGVLNGKSLPVIEIVPPEGRMFDFDAKYEHKNGDTKYLSPPETIPESVQDLARNYSEKAFKALGARDMLRVDFIVDDEDRLHALEANSIPGFTASSLLPKAAARTGTSFLRLCATLVQNAARR